MKYASILAAALVATVALPVAAQTLPGAPETNGLSPKTATFYINTPTNGVNNGGSEAPGIGIANNGNILVAWEDDGADIADIEAVWTMFNAEGNWLTPPTKIDSLYLGLSVTNQYLSFFRPDGSATPGYVSWGPKVHANLFGTGIGMGANGMDGLGAEIAAYASYVGNGDFPAVQLLDSNGKPVSNVAGVTSDYSALATSSIRIGDWEYLANGNIVIAADSRQSDDWNSLYGGTNASAYQHSIYRIVTPSGVEVKAASLISDTSYQVGNQNLWHGLGVSSNGFAIRFPDSVRGTCVRFFDNNGTPLTTNLPLTTLVGDPRAGGGGRGDGAGFHGNGKDAYVHAADYNLNGTNGFWVTVLNANGTVRWAKDVASDLTVTGVGRGDAAINENGEVVVVFDAKADPSLPNGVIGRRFDASGNPVGGTFYVSEVEVPDPANGNLFASTVPRVAWRGGKIAIAWITANDVNNSNAKEIALRVFTASPLPGKPEDNGFTPKTFTSYVNSTNGVNNGGTEAPGVGISKSGKVLVAWEDDGADIADIEAVWTMFNSDGSWFTPPTKIDSLFLSISVTNQYLSFFRPDGSATPGYVSWGPKIHANLFGSGIGMGASGMDGLGAEIASYASYVGNGDFPAVQLLDDNGGPLSNVAGVTSAYSAAGGSIRIGDWDYLSNGNIVIAGDSRQNDDLVNVYGGAAPFQHSIYRIVTPAGVEVKAASLISDTANQTGNQNMWHGLGVTANGFAIRFPDSTRGVCVRLFDNAGTALTTNLPLTTITGYPQAGGGGRGDGAGFHGNGKDAYVHAADYTYGGVSGFWVTVLNANGTVRWTRDVSDDILIQPGSIGRGDAAIDENGQVIVVFDAKPQGLIYRVPMGRRFDASGTPMGGTFYLSEKEVPSFDATLSDSSVPRVAWRNGDAAVVWISKNDPNNFAVSEIAQRYFITGAPSLSVSQVGNSVKISWPVGLAGFTLQSSSTLGATASWGTVGGVVNNSVTVSNPTGNKFYRLIK